MVIIIVITDTAGITPPLPRMILFNVIVIIVIITIIQLKMEQPQTHRLCAFAYICDSILEVSCTHVCAIAYAGIYMYVRAI